MLRKGMHVNADAADDNHNGNFQDNFGGYVMVAAESLTHDNILNALMEGKYYSVGGVDGPRTDQIIIDGRNVTVSCGSGRTMNIIAGGYVGAGTTIMAQKEKKIAEADAKLTGTQRHTSVWNVWMNMEEQHGQIHIIYKIKIIGC